MDKETTKALQMAVAGFSAALAHVEARAVACDLLLDAIIQTLPNRQALIAALRSSIDSKVLSESSSPTQREAHQRVGRYLELLASEESEGSPPDSE